MQLFFINIIIPLNDILILPGRLQKSVAKQKVLTYLNNIREKGDTMKKNLYTAAVIITAAILSVASCGRSLYNFAQKSERGKASLVEKSIQAGEHKIVYLESGEDGEIIVLVHGFGGDKDNWTRFSRYINKGYRIIAPDLPGFGESSRIEGAFYDIETQTERLRKFTEILGLKKFHLAGNSMGGWISANYAYRHKEQVLTLTLINAAGITSPVKSEMMALLEKGINPLLVNDLHDYDRLINFLFVKPPYIPGSIKKEFALKAVEHRSFNNKIFHDLHKKPLKLETRLPGIKAPSFVIWGDTDRVLHVSSVRVFTTGIKNSRSYILKGCGHLPMIERPKETAGVFINFISGKGPAD